MVEVWARPFDEIRSEALPHGYTLDGNDYVLCNSDKSNFLFIYVRRTNGPGQYHAHWNVLECAGVLGYEIDTSK